MAPGTKITTSLLRLHYSFVTLTCPYFAGLRMSRFSWKCDLRLSADHHLRKSNKRKVIFFFTHLKSNIFYRIQLLFNDLIINWPLDIYFIKNKLALRILFVDIVWIPYQTLLTSLKNNNWNVFLLRTICSIINSGTVCFSYSLWHQKQLSTSGYSLFFRGFYFPRILIKA